MAKLSAATPDAIPNSWVDRAPSYAQPYLRLMRADRPIGTWLLLIPCWWGLALAASAETSLPMLLWYAVLFSVGAIVMRGAGCVYNDIIDREIDAKVERTALRPLPSGQVTAGEAWTLLVALCLIGLAVLLQLNRFTIFTGLASLALVAAYPFMKRITFWPQAWLGLTFNWGALVGYAAIRETLEPAAFALYGAGIFWTLGYDTIYANQDTEDDALIGVKSTALKFGESTKKWLAFFFTMTIALFALALAASESHALAYVFLLPAAAHFVWQLGKLDIHDSHNCLKRFKSNREAGLLLLLAPLAEAIMRLN